MNPVLTGGSAITELRRALEEYLSVLIGLTKRGIFIFLILQLYSVSVSVSWMIVPILCRNHWWWINRVQMEKFRKWTTSKIGACIHTLCCLLIHNLLSCNWVSNNKHGGQEICVANFWFELLSIVHLMAMLTLSEADSLMIPKDHSGSGLRVVSSGHIYKPIFRYLSSRKRL